MEALPPNALDLMVLKTLKTGPMHGYAIAQRIHAVSEEALAVEEGTLYPALHRMQRKGMLKSTWGKTDTGRRARFYTVTPEGKERLAQEGKRWKKQAQAIGRVLGLKLA